jgi:hypothetical protein
MRDVQALSDHVRRAPDPQRYVHIVAAAKHRRHRAAAAGAVGLAVVAAVAAMLWTGGSGVNGLRVEPAVTPTSGPPAAHAVRSLPPHSRTDVPTSSAGQGMTGPIVPVPAKASGQGGQRTSAGNTERTPDRQSRSLPMHRTYSGSGSQTVCGGIVAGAGPPTNPHYCGGLDAASSAAGTISFDLAGTLDAASRPSQFTFPTSQEVDLAIYRGHTLIWRWSATQRFSADAHALALASGSSYDWTTSWHATDRSGRPLPHGDYRVVGTILARELGTSNSWDTTLSL